MKTITLYPSWGLKKFNCIYYISYTHYVYLEFIVKQYDFVELIAPVEIINEKTSMLPILFDNLKIIELPCFKGYVQGVLRFFSIFRALKEATASIVYVRPPTPLSWMPRLLLNKKTIMHFVGDIIGSTINSQSGNRIFKTLKLLFFMPEYILVLFAAKKSNVFVNGDALSLKLKSYGIKVQSLVSSTLKDEDFAQLPKCRKNIRSKISLCYLGYLRPSKGIKTLVSLFSLLENDNIDYTFTIIGDGSMREYLADVISSLGITDKVFLKGHIENREEIRFYLNRADLFIFPSLSEGSPRVVLEAMAQGTCVISTPVGSLPTTFENGENILFFPFEDAIKINEIVNDYIVNNKKYEEIALNAYSIVKEKYTLSKFLSEIFSDET